jgi:hypothetical protein
MANKYNGPLFVALFSSERAGMSGRVSRTSWPTHLALLVEGQQIQKIIAFYIHVPVVAFPQRVRVVGKKQDAGVVDLVWKQISQPQYPILRPRRHGMVSVTVQVETVNGHDAGIGQFSGLASLGIMTNV